MKKVSIVLSLIRLGLSIASLIAAISLYNELNKDE